MAYSIYRNFLTISFLFMLIPAFLKAQSNDDSGNNWICFATCSNDINIFKKNCHSSSLSSYKPVRNEINPYILFDSVIIKAIDALYFTLGSDQESKKFNLDYTFRECSAVCNAAASRTSENEQLIVYNPAFLEQLYSTEKNKWAVICIFAHEIGHHLLGHTTQDYKIISTADKRMNELRADYFSGFILRRFAEATVENALEGLNTLDALLYRPRTALEEKYNDYPLLSKRIEAVTAGFTNGMMNIEIFQDIKQHALNVGVGVIFREIDSAFKSGDLEFLRIFLLEYLQQNQLTDEELRKSNKLLHELEKELRKELDIRSEFELRAKDSKIYIKDSDLEKLRLKEFQSEILQNRVIKGY